MRSISRAFAIMITIVILSSSVPAFAAPADGGPRIGSRITISAAIKRVVKRIFGISTQESITVPIPGAVQTP